MAEITQSSLNPGGAAAARPINQRAIFFASFMTLIAVGIGFGVRGGMLAEWASQFGFSKTDLGNISGMGLAGFGLTIIFFSFFADLVGYRVLLLLAFVLLVLSGILTVLATPLYNMQGTPEAGRHVAYWVLYFGMFIFSLAQGLCEAAINPLTATLFPTKKTHYLNILHAGWPGGLVLGGLLNYLFATKSAAIFHVPWEVLALSYLVPTLYFGYVVLKERFPVSEAKAAGVGLGQMLVSLVAPILLFLFLIHAMIGYVELGTDSWVQNILGNTLGRTAFLVFVYTSLLMFVMRFFAGPIVHKINPLGLLLIAACCGAVGLFLLGSNTTGILIWVAATIFALGKSFYWPTMLGVIGERFPRGGALAMGISGGIGMLSAGFLGGPGIGYTQDYNASHQLQAQTASPGAYDRMKAAQANHFLLFPEIQGLDGQKVDIVTEKPPATTLTEDLAKKPDDKVLLALKKWYDGDERKHVASDAAPVHEAVIFGGEEALKVTALVPVAMAACYLLLVFFFISRGGYKAIHLDSSGREIEVAHNAKEEEAIEAGAPTADV